MAETQRTEQRAGPVEINVPASSEHLRILRLVTSSLGASLGFDVDQLDDLRIAVDELCSMMMKHAAPGARLRLTLQDDNGRLSVDGGLPDEVPTAEAIEPVSQLILDGLDIDWSMDPGSLSFCLVAPGGRHLDGS